MLPRLEAERLLGDYRVALAASGGMKAPDRRKFLSDLKKAARGNERPRKATAKDLAALPIAVEEVPVKGGET
jgi:hypothetical protein